MQMQVNSKNLELSEAVRRYLDSKVSKLANHLPNILETKVELAKEKAKSPEQRFRVQVTLNSNGTLLRGEERAEALYAAIDKVVDVLERQIERYKGKHWDKTRAALATKNLEPTPTTAEEEPPSKIVRVKRFEVKPMSTEEALEQMELLGHDFFLFLNSSSSEFNLLYRRKDGGYGLIETQTH